MTLGKLFQLFYVIAIVIAIVAGLIQTIIIFRRNKGTKIPKTSKKEEKVQLTEQVKWQDFLARMKNNITYYISIAEKAFKGMKGLVDNYGELKLENVLSKIRTDCLEQGVKYDESYWRNYIENLISFTKYVNNGKDADKSKEKTAGTFKDEKVG